MTPKPTRSDKKGCCDEPKNHKFKCPHCGKESDNDNLLYKHMRKSHPNKIHFVIIKTFTKMGKTK